MSGQPGDGGKVSASGVPAKVPKIYFPDHFLAQWRHGLPPWLGINPWRYPYTIRVKRID